MVKKIVKMMLGMLLTVALLSGCMRVEESFTVRQDGNVSFYAEVLYEKQKVLEAVREFSEEAGESISEQKITEWMEQEGYKLVTREGKEYFTALAFEESEYSSSLGKFYEENNMFSPETEKDDYISLTETSFEAALTTAFQDMDDFWDGDDVFGKNYRMQDGSEEYEMIQKYMKSSELVLSVTFAAPIVKVSEGAVLSADKKTVSFPASMSDTAVKEIYAYCENDIALSGVKSGMIYGKTVSYTIPEGVKATLNGSAVEGAVSSEKTGTYELCLKAADGAQKTVYYKVDKEGPVIKGIQNNGIYNGKKIITMSDTSGIDRVLVDGKNVFGELAADFQGMEFLEYLKYPYSFTGLKEGKHTIQAIDKLGNATSVSFQIDKTAPKVTGVKNNKTYKSAVTVHVTDKNGIKSITLNGKKIKSGKQISKNGSYRLVAKDAAGNKTIVRFRIKE